mmetsp:Transcript_121064/g.210551  ORF Transcript_121064/g.210551 Transcript_121064/m.210551 type:complete len:146 (-) Transcript_121064:1136-1573(-)
MFQTSWTTIVRNTHLDPYEVPIQEERITFRYKDDGSRTRTGYVKTQSLHQKSLLLLGGRNRNRACVDEVEVAATMDDCMNGIRTEACSGAANIARQEKWVAKTLANPSQATASSRGGNKHSFNQKSVLQFANPANTLWRVGTGTV